MLTGLRSGCSRLPVFGFELDEADVAEVGTVSEPQRPVRGIAKHARVDGIAVLDAVGPHDRAAVLPFVVRARRDRASCRPAGRSRTSAACRAPSSRGSSLSPIRMTSGAQVLLPPRARTSGPGRPPGTRLHHLPGAPPGPSVIRDERRQAGARAVDVELAVVPASRSTGRAFPARLHRVPATGA